MIRIYESVPKFRLLLTPAALLMLLVTAWAASAVEPAPQAGPNASGKTAAPPALNGAPATANTPPSSADWPCVQARVDKIDAATVWDGPAIEGVKGDPDDAMDALIKTALSRRTALPDVEKAIAAYAKSVAEGERDTKLTLAFANILKSANTQRTGILNGIERFQKRQRSNAKEIEAQGAAISELEAKAPSDLTQTTPELDAAREKYDWFTRVFQERQANIPIACEIPTLIDQRVFAVARAIRAQMKN